MIGLKTLQRYVLREVLTATAMSMAVLTFLLVASYIFSEAGDLTGRLTFGTLFKMFLYVLPTLVMLTLPISLLIGALIGIGRLTVDSEIKAMRTHGVNLFRTFVPVFGLGALATALMLANNFYFAPYVFTYNLRMIDMLILESISALEPGKFHDDLLDFGGSSGVLYFKEKDAETGEMKNVYLSIENVASSFESEEATDKEKEEEAREAEEAQALAAAEKIDDASTTVTAEDAGGAASDMLLSMFKTAAVSMTTSSEPVNTLFLAASGRIETDEIQGRASLVLTSGTIHFIQDRGRDQYIAISFDSARQRMQVDAEKELTSSNLGLRLRGLTFSDVIREIAQLKVELEAEYAAKPFMRQQEKIPKKLRVIRRMIADLFRRVSISFASFAFVLIAVPLAVYIRPSGKSVGVSIAFVLVMMYFAFLYFGDDLTRNGSMILGPFFLLLPILLLVSSGAYLTYRVVHR